MSAPIKTPLEVTRSAHPLIARSLLDGRLAVLRSLALWRAFPLVTTPVTGMTRRWLLCRNVAALTFRRFSRWVRAWHGNARITTPLPVPLGILGLAWYEVTFNVINMICCALLAWLLVACLAFAIFCL